jgi:uncharacterized phage protein (TIGR01671 family)
MRSALFGMATTASGRRMKMREILFRGKRKDNGGMVFGDLSQHKNGKVFIKSGSATHSYEVDPDTVGQFTGLTDKNGKKIFEGDIVHILGNQDVEDWKGVNYNALIAFLDGGFCAIDGTIDDHAFRRYALARMDFDLEVIGNIHDNPELLEGE